MALTEKVEQKLEILPNGVIQVTDTTVIERDGVVIATPDDKHVVDVGDDLGKESARLKGIADLVWTPKVRAARKAFKAKQEADIA